MRAVVTRVLSASVEIGGKTAGAIEKGILVLLGVHEDDTEVTHQPVGKVILHHRVVLDKIVEAQFVQTVQGLALLIMIKFQLKAVARTAGSPDR